MIATVAAETESLAFVNQPIQVSVTWVDNQTDDGKWTIEPGEVKINKRVALILYRLSPASTPGVRFATGENNEPSPVLWISPSNPDNFDVTVVDNGQQLVIADANDRPADRQTFSFRLVAVYNGVTRISPDPTIINVDPTQPTSPVAS